MNILLDVAIKGAPGTDWAPTWLAPRRHDVNELLQVLALLHKRHANVLDGWIQLQQKLSILNILHSSSSMFQCVFCFQLFLTIVRLKKHPSLEVKAAQLISRSGTLTPLRALRSLEEFDHNTSTLEEREEW